MRKSLVLLVGVVLAASGCGGGSSSDPAVSITLSPTSASVHLLRTMQFTATVHNATNTAVNWSVSGADCSGAQANCGSVSSAGLYTAPPSRPSPPTVTVTATSVADASRSASATVTILASVVMTVSPADQDVKVGETQQYTVTVQNAIDSHVNWTVSGAGCTGAACGTISSTGLYTAPSAVPNPPAITVKATSAEDPLASASVQATVVSVVGLALSPPRVLVAVGTSYQFGAFVTGTTNTAVDWTLSGAACSGAACGTIGPTGLYTAPPAVPSFDEVTVTATSVVDPAKSATATVRILASNAGKLNGGYSFLYQGFALGAPGATAGMFMADGQGNLTYGISDRAWPDAVGGNLVGARFTGTYQVGDDNRGLLYLHSAVFGDVTLAFALNAAGDEAFIQPFFDVTTRLLGKLVKLDLPVSDNSAITGDYVFQWLGADAAGNRRGALGRLHADGYGVITTGKLDINNGTSVLEDLALTGSYSVSWDGRATMTLVVPTVGTIHLVAYALTSDRFFMMSIDTVSGSAPMWSGLARAQDGQPFSDASLQGTGVFDLLGRPGATQARTGIGLLTSDAGCRITGVLDTNVNGTVATDTAYTATCSIRSDGRGTLTSATLPPMIFYVVSPGTALLMGAPGAAVDLGFLEPQRPAPYNATAIVGRFAEGASVPPPYDGNLVLTGVVLCDPSGGFTWTLDVVSSTSGLSSGGSTAVVSSVGAGGHGVLTDGSGNHSYLYTISPMKVVVVEGNVPQQAMVDQNLLYNMIR
jgi:hypothetical protein